jgi:hypothetical protein
MITAPAVILSSTEGNVNLIDYQKVIGHARDPLELMQVLRGMDRGWVGEAVEVVASMDAAAFEEWQLGLTKERTDVWNPTWWYSRYGNLLRPPAYARAMELEFTQDGVEDLSETPE